MLGLQWPLPTEGLDMVRDTVSDRSAEQTAVRLGVQSKEIRSISVTFSEDIWMESGETK